MPTFDFLRLEPDIRSFHHGELIFREGDAADCMFGVVEGAAEIALDGKVIERITVGGVFGEMALIDHLPRSATAVAAGECTLAVIDEKGFLRLVEQMPRFALLMMQVVTERLRRARPE